MYQLAQFVFCGKCGRYAQHRAANLQSACKGHHGSNRVAKLSLGRLTQVKHPITGARLGGPIELLGVETAIGASCSWNEVQEGIELQG